MTVEQRPTISVLSEVVAHAVSLAILLAGLYTVNVLLHLFGNGFTLFAGTALALRTDTFVALADWIVVITFVLQSLASVLARTLR